MLKVVATEVKQRLGQYLENAQSEPVIIQKSGRPSVVMLSFAEYERLQALDDAWWGEKARQAIDRGFAGVDETMRRLQERLNAEA